MNDASLTSSDFTLREEPYALFAEWFAEAAEHEVNDPNAMALATVDPGGMPNVRMVLLKGFDPTGFVFYTNLESAKGGEIVAAGKAALCFHWKSLARQVRVRGNVEKVSDAEADAYYASRPLGSRIGAWASRQSQPLPDRETLARSVAEYEARYGEGEVPRPAHWTGFRIRPVSIEFWHDRPYRLHDRVVFQPEGDGWSRTRLYP